ncbi:MAG: HEAT repeat domain-containing protein [Eudoraea sp.]|nr:HEAT repeat domain-containing protein [Eudoraea sp.]
MNKLELTYKAYSLLSIPKIHTDLLWDLSMLFGGLGLLYFGIIFYFRNKSSKRKRSDLERRKNLAPSISNFLFFEEESSREEQNEYIDLKVQIREFIKEPKNKRVLREILLDLQKDLTGDSRKKLFKLYLDYDLHLDAYSKLKSWRWQVISKGIQELTQMQVVEAYSFIKKFINDPRSVIRKQAQIATVSLKHEGIAHFLDTNKYHISEWQQIKILEVLQNLEDFIPPKFGAWLTSNNKDVVLFSLRLIKVYNQIDANLAITELVKHRDNEIKIAAIHCIKEFGIADSLPTLKASFHKCSAETKIALVGAIGYLGDHSALEYLETIYKKESNFNVQSKIISAINEIAPESILPTLDLDPSIDVIEEVEVATETNEEQPVTDLTEEISIDTSKIPTVAIPEEGIDEGSTEPVEMKVVAAPEEVIEESVSEDTVIPIEVELQKEDETIEHQPLEDDHKFSGVHLEDLDIFEICFMEELNDLLSEEPSTDESAMYNEYLPLDFLPIVAHKTTTAMSKNKKQPDSNQSTRNLDVIFDHIHPDENFRKELEDILSRIEIPNEEGNVDVEYMNFKFLPFVVSEESQHNDIAEVPYQNEHCDLEEIYDEEALEKASEEVSMEEPTTEVNADTCLLVDWSKVSDDEQATHEEPSEEVPEPVLEIKESYGFSIFEELFRSCDTESKLILMDEIMPIGDEKEVHFLRSLFKDKNAQVRKKAIEIEGLLVKRLESELSDGDFSESYVHWASDSNETELLDIHFELENNKENDKPQDKESE